MRSDSLTKRVLLLPVAIMLAVVCCGALIIGKPLRPATKKAAFGKTLDGKQVDIYTLTNSHGAEARIINYGGIVVSLKVPDRNGNFDDVVLGYDSMDGYNKQ